MQFKISEDKSISMTDILQECKTINDKTYYFLGENKADSLKKLTASIEKLGKNIYIKKIKFSLETDDFVYSVHIV